MPSPVISSFFVGTYDTPGVSHVGIYVGDGVMIHCGDPIQYTSINSSYRPKKNAPSAFTASGGEPIWRNITGYCIITC